MPAFRCILLCYDGTREGQHALKDGAALARDLKAEVHVLSVVNNAVWAYAADITSATAAEVVTESARSLLEEGLKKLASRGLRATGHFAGRSAGSDSVLCGRPEGRSYRRWPSSYQSPCALVGRQERWPVTGPCQLQRACDDGAGNGYG